MKILYIGSCGTGDYLQDMLFHGLRSLHGADVVDIPRLDYMYQGFDTSTLYGKGFTLFGLLPEVAVDRDDIPRKIETGFFDLVIYGSCRREHLYLDQVIAAYPRHRIAFIDGEDIPGYLPGLAKLGIYFKRELHSPQPLVHPIQFAIPEEKLIGAARKSRFMATLDPTRKDTYIYEDEKSYYDGYRSSLFAVTLKKAGWDCLRHYEIMAAECIPYFMDLPDCPHTIMQHLPKKELIIAKTLIEYDDGKIFYSYAGQELWSDLNRKIQETLREHLTTKALAQRTIDTILRESDHGTGTVTQHSPVRELRDLPAQYIGA